MEPEPEAICSMQAHEAQGNAGVRRFPKDESGKINGRSNDKQPCLLPQTRSLEKESIQPAEDWGSNMKRTAVRQRNLSKNPWPSSPAWIPLFVLCLVCLLQGCSLQEDYEILISHHDESKASQGQTVFLSHVFFPGYFLVEMGGEVLWYRLKQDTLQGNGVGLDVTRDGNLLIMHDESRPSIVDPDTNTILWANTEYWGHHTLAETPWGNVMTLQVEEVEVNYPPWALCPVYGDVIVEIDVPSGDIVWEWHLKDYLDPVLHHADDACIEGFGILDWSHCNTVKVMENYYFHGHLYNTVVLLLARNLDTFWMIDYATGHVIWSCGQHGDFGRREPPEEPLFSTPHEVELLENGNFIMFDNGGNRSTKVSRALEFAVDPQAGTAEEVWSWTEPHETMYSPWGGDANRLANGNTLITDVQKARLIEVDPAGEKVWQLEIRQKDAPEELNLYSIFMGERIP